MSLAGQFINAVKAGVTSTTPDNDTLGANGFTTIYTAPAGGGGLPPKTSYVIECDIASTGSTGVQASVRLRKSDGQVVFLVRGSPVPVGSTIQIIDGQKLVLMPGDSLQVKCETEDNNVDVIVSLVEDVNS